MRRTLWLALLLALVATACTPAANVARSLVERADGASVEYLSDGVGFDPGEEVAVGTILVLTGDDIEITGTPEGAECEQEAENRFDCGLGDVEEPVVVNLTGQDILGIANFRRPGSNEFYQAIGY